MFTLTGIRSLLSTGVIQNLKRENKQTLSLRTLQVTLLNHNSAKEIETRLHTQTPVGSLIFLTKTRRFELSVEKVKV